MNFKQLAQQFKDELLDIYPVEEVLSLFYIAVEHVSGFSRGIILLKGLEEVEADKQTMLLEILDILKSGMPLQYVLGKTEFFGLQLKVNSSVLIPRAETEELVEWIIATEKVQSGDHTRKRTFLDVGTGSGCIAIALKKQLKNISMSAMDVSDDALMVARENTVSNETPVSFIHTDILCYHSADKYDVIVSNPPYITTAEKTDMHKNVLAHEPHLALFVNNEDPLLFYKAIADFAVSNLNPDGSLFFEINEFLGKETVEMLEHKKLKNIELKKDMQGKDRMIRCNLQG